MAPRTATFTMTRKQIEGLSTMAQQTGRRADPLLSMTPAQLAGVGLGTGYQLPNEQTSPSDVALDSRSSSVAGEMSFATATLSPTFTASNSVLNGIHASPNQLTNGEGAVTGREVQFTVTFTTPLVLPESTTEQWVLLSALLGKGPAPAAIVRRYRVDSSPVIRDLKHGWRTGRTELVFEGHFDLIAEVWPATAEERRS